MDDDHIWFGKSVQIDNAKKVFGLNLATFERLKFNIFCRASISISFSLSLSFSLALFRAEC